MMMLGSVLLPEEPVDAQGVQPAFYLDDEPTRDLIASQLATHPHDFFHNASISSWGFIGRQDSTRTLARRFYAINKTRDLAWGYVIVPNAAEKAAEDSIIPANAVVLPDFGSVTNTMRYRAIGA